MNVDHTFAGYKLQMTNDFGKKMWKFDHGVPTAARQFQIREQHCVSSNGKTVVPRKRLNMNQSFSRIQVEKAVQIYSNKFKQVQQSSKRAKLTIFEIFIAFSRTAAEQNLH